MPSPSQGSPLEDAKLGAYALVSDDDVAPGWGNEVMEAEAPSSSMTRVLMPSPGGMELIPLHSHRRSYSVRVRTQTREWGDARL